ncbi:SDR family oxidoreductase [Algoriphagus sp. H41]|uniref:SDR family oxidoreductase n=1 Tax=Algoriphagus oliviformis TaxID=2811231 RepID=A0ABS3C570_9BACT|nr:SDR family oxidoreductase [Algoriphagus oliviformis]MBN7812247.1 SDR family oxidoreductase [Algoriphagus oliviformis]
MKIAVTGATGQLGTLVIAQLKTQVSTENLVALARNTEKAGALGTEVRPFDYAQPEILAKSLQGVDRLLLISSSEIGHRFAQHSNVIAAAQQAGVKWIVYTSLLHAPESSLSLAGEHVATEKLLAESGIAHTILRNGWYHENFISSIQASVAMGTYAGSAGEGKISAASRQDFAEAAAKVILDEKHIGKVYELAGDTAYTLTELSSEISEQSGKEVSYANMPEAAYADILKGAGLPAGLAEAIAGWDTSISQGDLLDESKQLSQLIGRPTSPVADTVQAALKQ